MELAIVPFRSSAGDEPVVTFAFRPVDARDG